MEVKHVIHSWLTHLYIQIDVICIYGLLKKKYIVYL